MDDLAVWLAACLDEDERLARECRGIFPSPGVDEDGTVWLHVRPGGNAVLVRQRDPVAGYDDLAKLRGWASAENGWTQERVLREVDAKRRIVAEHPAGAGWDGRDVDGLVCRTCAEDSSDGGRSGDPFPCTTLRLVALPYADRPGYRSEWRP